MEAFSRLIGLTGRWRGTYQLTVSPAEPARESQSTAVVSDEHPGSLVSPFRLHGSLHVIRFSA
jgi:hypothetical protein